jgi:serine/threonine-protein phosphatase 6 regulatory ankyrin repeat subunit B
MCLRIFTDKGIDVNKIANSGGTALMFAAGGGHNETTRLLLDSKSDVNVVVRAKPEYIEQVAKSIAAGKEDVEPHKDGVTALMVAAQGGHIGTVTMLVEAAAQVRIADDEGMTPLLNAVKGNFGNVASYLVEHGADPNDVFVDEKGKAHNLLMDSVVVSNKEFALLLIEKGANISYADAEGVTLVTQAAYQGQLAVVEALMAKGADVTVANNEGINSLIAAASEGHQDVVKAILASGKADANAKDKDGTNALMAAAVRGHKDVVSVLLESGVVVNAQVGIS